MKIAFVVNQVAGNWSPLDARTWGGGEEALVRLARAFRDLGHEMTVFWQGGPGFRDPGGVQWENYNAMAQKRDAFDIAIFRKTPELLPMAKIAPRNILWDDMIRPFDPSGFERVVVASDFLKRIFAQMTPACAHLLTKIHEGTEFSLFPSSLPERDSNLVIYTSSPDRGLRDLLVMWPEVEKARPNARLLITYGWERFDACGGDPALKEEILSLASGHKVEFSGNVSQEEIFKLYTTAGVWAYPCTGGEHYCHSAIRAQLGGAIPVVLHWGALSETVWSGYPVTNLKDFQEKLIHALDPVNQIRLRLELHDRVLDTAMPIGERSPITQSWEDVAKEWQEVVFAGTQSTDTASFLKSIPGSPPFDVSTAVLAAPRIWPTLAQWLESVQAKRPFIDPSLGISVRVPGGMPEVGEGDAVILGYALEDDSENPKEVFKRLGLKDGTPIAVVASHGPYRAEHRRRAFDRRALDEVFGKQQEFSLRSMPLDGEGNSASIAFFRLDNKQIGQRDLKRVLRTLGPRQTISACFITRDAADTITPTLRSLIGVVDEICILDNGSTDSTLEDVERFAKFSGIPVIVQHGYSPRWCFDCLKVHDLGEIAHGHRVAGFETPRNQSLAMAGGDWIIWLDADEKLINGKALGKYLRNNMFEGYCIQQHHFSVDPPQAMKIDLPVRVFRRKVDPAAPTPGLIEYGDLKWPTYHTGLTVRFGGVVHEHPGFGPTYGEGLGPVIILSDVWIAHDGYFTEAARRKRFVRNWPLMIADRQKYPDRRLGKFLWIRDLCHQMRYLLETTGGNRTPEVDALANESLAMWRKYFVDSADPFAPDALQYARIAQQILQRGMEVTVQFKASKPEISGDEKVEFVLDGRYEDKEQIIKAFSARMGELERWDGEWV